MNSGPILSIGATGHDVRRLQRIFVMTKVLAPSNITGTFDVTTEQAVKDFQQDTGLVVDGIVGPATWQALPEHTKRIALSMWMGSLAIRRGGLPRAPLVLLSPRFPDLRRFDLSGSA